MSLQDKQIKFTALFTKLIAWINEQPEYFCSIGEVERSKEQHIRNIEAGKTKARTSMHQYNLAGDLRIYKKGVYLTKTEDYKFAGEYWESLSPECVWGGRFGDNPSTPTIEGWDGNHFQYGKKVGI